MGSWGYKALDNDGGMDFVDGILKQIAKPLLRKRCDYEEVRAAAKILRLISKGDSFASGEVLAAAIEKLELIKNDKKWIDDWKDTLKIKQEIKKELRAMKRLYENR